MKGGAYPDSGRSGRIVGVLGRRRAAFQSAISLRRNAHPRRAFFARPRLRCSPGRAAIAIAAPTPPKNEPSAFGHAAASGEKPASENFALAELALQEGLQGGAGGEEAEEGREDGEGHREIRQGAGALREAIRIHEPYAEAWNMVGYCSRNVGTCAGPSTPTTVAGDRSGVRGSPRVSGRGLRDGRESREGAGAAGLAGSEEVGRGEGAGRGDRGGREGERRDEGVRGSGTAPAAAAAPDSAAADSASGR